MIRKAAWILIVVFGLTLVGATLMNALLIGESRQALSEGILQDKTSLELARYHLVLVIPDTSDSFFDGIVEGINKKAPSFGAALQIFRYPGGSETEAERYFQLSLGAKVDGLIMYDRDGGQIALRSVLAAQNGLVFVPVGTQPPPTNRRGFIGSGSFLQGVGGGKLIAAKLGAVARVGVILPSEGLEDLEAEPLYEGVVSAIRPYHGAIIEAQARARPGILSGEEAAVTMLRAHPGLNALFCSNAQITEGAAQVVVDTNRVGRITIIGTDETPAIRRYIDKGVIAASIVRDSVRIGEEAVKAFSRLKAGQTPQDAVEVGFFIHTVNGMER